MHGLAKPREKRVVDGETMLLRGADERPEGRRIARRMNTRVGTMAANDAAKRLQDECSSAENATRWVDVVRVVRAMQLIRDIECVMGEAVGSVPDDVERYGIALPGNAKHCRRELRDLEPAKVLPVEHPQALANIGELPCVKDHRQESGGGTTPVSSPGWRPQCLDSEKPATALVALEIPKATAQNEEVPRAFSG